MTPTEQEVTAVPLPLGAWRVDPGHSTIGFEVREMAHIFATVRGRFTDYDGVIDIAPESARASATIRVASIATDNNERDDNLRSPEFLDAEASPVLRFESDAIDVREDCSICVTGWLELKGVRSDVELRGQILGSGTDHRGEERLAIAADGMLPFGPLKVRLMIDISAVRPTPGRPA